MLVSSALQPWLVPIPVKHHQGGCLVRLSIQPSSLRKGYVRDPSGSQLRPLPTFAAYGYEVALKGHATLASSSLCATSSTPIEAAMDDAFASAC